MVLARLLGNIAPARFMEDYYLRLPFAEPGGCQALAHLGDWSMLEKLLACAGVDVLAGREGGERPAAPPANGEQARAVLAAGYTIGIRQAHLHDAELAGLATEFREDFGAPVDIHLYCTPAGQPGFGWHYDAEDVLILQTRGSKEWSLRKNTVNPWPLIEALPADMRYEREIMPLQRCNLLAGDWLYIPGGYWHRTSAGEESMSLSVGIATPTALDVLDFLRKRLRSSLRWRQRLPPAGRASPWRQEELLARYQTVFADLGHHLAEQLAAAGLARDFLDHQQGRSAGVAGPWPPSTDLH